MSVQAGIWNLDGRPIEPELLADFSQSLKHQGPDGAFLHVNGSVGLLYRPFHTTAESRSEEQPYVSGRGFILTWDGRLDNRHDLTAQFRRDLQASSADIAIVAAAFDRLETNCFREIIGDWAIAVWKPEQRELILAVDYMAIRHIFYRVNRDQLMWSTDLAALVLFSGDHFRIDDEYVAGYLASDPNAQVTPYREIRQVPPGQVVHITDGRIWTERYWVTPKSRICYKSDAGYEEHFRHVFRQSVRRRLRSDSPILADLSGGLDSSSIVCMADDILAKEGAQTPRLDTLSYYDKTEPNGDDWIYFQKLEELRGRVGSHIDLERCTLSVSLEYPTFAPLPGAIGARHKMEAERANIVRDGSYRVGLSGLGGDEFMGGNPDPREQLADLIVQFKPISLARQLAAWSLTKRRPWLHLLWQSSMTLLSPAVRAYLLKESKLEPWIDKHFAKRHHLAARRIGTGNVFRIS